MSAARLIAVASCRACPYYREIDASMAGSNGKPSTMAVDVCLCHCSAFNRQDQEDRFNNGTPNWCPLPVLPVIK